MAIQKNYTDISGVDHPESYTKIESVSITDWNTEIQVSIYHNAATRSKSDFSASKEPLVRPMTTVTGDVHTTYFADSVLKADTKSPVIQAYAWLKTQTKFAGIDWTSGTTDV